MSCFEIFTILPSRLQSGALTWVMTACPFVTFPGVEPGGLSLGETLIFISVPWCLLAWVTSVALYNLTCILPKRYSHILSVLHTNLFWLSPYGEHYSFFLNNSLYFFIIKHLLNLKGLWSFFFKLKAFCLQRFRCEPAPGVTSIKQPRSFSHLSREHICQHLKIKCRSNKSNCLFCGNTVWMLNISKEP